jgi:hypothetical protein
MSLVNGCDGLLPVAGDPLWQREHTSVVSAWLNGETNCPQLPAASPGLIWQASQLFDVIGWEGDIPSVTEPL